MNSRECLELKKLCLLNFLEIQNLKRILCKHFDINDDIYDYANSTEEYLKDLDSKTKNLLKHFNDTGRML